MALPPLFSAVYLYDDDDPKNYYIILVFNIMLLF